ncbi:MAG: aminotransferase class III-fold pyridoxal phosphate-dependent enzyme [Polyangiaceae bacterium]|nr:aminotransferase class III-fold pyridoxal phosphate-dependent enzyme [Polyangiaceae bacterium]
MTFSEIPPPPEERPGEDLPFLRVRPPGPLSRTWRLRASTCLAPMGAAPSDDGPGACRAAGSLVLARGLGCNVVDVDGNRFVDLAAGFGSLLLGHAPAAVSRAVELQAARLWQAMGDVHASDAKIGLAARLAELHPERGAQVILGQSGADAITAAIKTAALATGRPGVLGFEGSYHGLGYAPLAVSSFRPGYRAPFAAQLSPHVRFLPFPASAAGAAFVLERARVELARGDVGAIVVEPILGRGGCVVPPPGFLSTLGAEARAAGALVIADEIWTGLGRSGAWLASVDAGLTPELVCLGKGLGGGLPISACVGAPGVMAAWRRRPEVVHTSTFAGAPLACAAALATLDTLSRGGVVTQARGRGDHALAELRAAVGGAPGVREIRGAGWMIGVDLGDVPGAAARLASRLLEAGYLTSTGGGEREVLVLTPPLTLPEELFSAFVRALGDALSGRP